MILFFFYFYVEHEVACFANEASFEPVEDINKAQNVSLTFDILLISLIGCSILDMVYEILYLISLSNRHLQN